MPLVAGASASSTQPRGEGGAEVGVPLTHGFAADDDATLGQQILHVAEAEMEAEVQPDGVSDDLGREAAASIGRRSAGSATDIKPGLSPIRAQLDNSSEDASRANSFVEFGRNHYRYRSFQG
jgi:hypothetical protein